MIMTLAVNPLMQQLMSLRPGHPYPPIAIDHASVSGDGLSADLNMKAAA